MPYVTFWHLLLLSQFTLQTVFCCFEATFCLRLWTVFKLYLWFLEVNIKLSACLSFKTVIPNLSGSMDQQWRRRGRGWFCAHTGCLCKWSFVCLPAACVAWFAVPVRGPEVGDPCSKSYLVFYIDHSCLKLILSIGIRWWGTFSWSWRTRGKPCRCRQTDKKWRYRRVYKTP